MDSRGKKQQSFSVTGFQYEPEKRDNQKIALNMMTMTVERTILRPSVKYSLFAVSRSCAA